MVKEMSNVKDFHEGAISEPFDITSPRAMPKKVPGPN